jgi:hypothetical protein
MNHSLDPATIAQLSETLFALVVLYGLTPAFAESGR